MVRSQSGRRRKDTIVVQTCEILQNSHISSSPGHSRQDSMDPGNLDLDSGRCSCPSSSTHGMKPLERRRKREHQRCLAHSLVGTPNYIAPEVIFVILLIFQDASLPMQWGNTKMHIVQSSFFTLRVASSAHQSVVFLCMPLTLSNNCH